MLGNLVGFLYFGIPVGLLAAMVYCWNRYRDAKKQNAAQPGAVSQEELKKRKLIFVLVAAATGVLVTVMVGFVALLFMAIAFM